MKRLLFESECEECSLYNGSLSLKPQENEGKGRMHNIKHETLICGRRKSTNFKDTSRQRPKETFSRRSIKVGSSQFKIHTDF